MSIVIEKATIHLQDAAISQVEERIGMTMPRAYKSFLAEHNLSAVAPNRVVCGNEAFNISYFFGVGGDSHANLVDQFAIYSGRVPPNTVPIAMAGGGNIVLLDTSNGAILFWDHESEGADVARIIDVAPTFDAFLSLIDAYTPEFSVDVKINAVELRAGFANKFKDYLL